MQEFRIHVIAVNRCHGGVHQYQIDGFSSRESATQAAVAIQNTYFSSSEVNVGTTVIQIK